LVVIASSVLAFEAGFAITPELPQWDGEGGEDHRQVQGPEAEIDFNAVFREA